MARVNPTVAPSIHAVSMRSITWHEKPHFSLQSSTESSILEQEWRTSISFGTLTTSAALGVDCGQILTAPTSHISVRYISASRLPRELPSKIWPTD
jgi:hypothetical protein